MKIRIPVRPGVNEIIRPYYTGIGSCALSKVERSVFAKDQIVVLMISRVVNLDEVLLSLLFKSSPVIFPRWEI